MRDHAQRDDDEAEINMTPMLDIVFIMLIFFIVTAVFVKEAGIEVDKPSTFNSFPQKKAAILIAVTTNDEVWINRQRVDLAAVRAVVERLSAENPRGTVVVQADKEAKAGLTLEVLKAARAAGVSNVAIATKKK